jgi:hypothetical protein
MAREFKRYQQITGRKFKDDVQRPTFANTIEQLNKGAKSKYPLRLLGTSQDGDVWVSEEERSANFHILGAPGEGKSKFIEYHIRKDIDMGNGLCLIDPSEKGDTARNILNYCASINYQKVIWIDPITIAKYKKIPAIAPLSQKTVKRSVAGMMEALNILFDAKSTSTPRIRRYLSALLRILASRGMTLKDAHYFSQYYQGREMLKKLGFNPDVQTLKSVFRTEYNFENYFSSSINRMDALWQEPLASILGNNDGINFKRAVGDGWVILVNLSPYQLTEDEAELLGIIIISQIIQAIDALVNHNWKGVFYLYIDEAGRFATPQIETLLSYKRKSGLRLYLAHHHFEQFGERRKVLSSIENNARIKLMFDTPNYEDRMKMIKALGYGGNIPPLLASYANQNIPKQHAVLRKNKETPVRIKIPDVKPVPEASESYIKEILSQDFYKNVDEYQRRSVSDHPRSDESGKMDDHRADRKATVSRRTQKQVQDRSQQSEQKPPNPPERKPRKI